MSEALKKLALISYGYSGKGHGKEYVRNFYYNLKKRYEITLLTTSEEIIRDEVESDIVIQKLPFNISVKQTSIRGLNDVLRNQYFRQKITYKFVKAALQTDVVLEADILFVMDYTALSLLSFLYNYKKNKPQKVYLWIHSARFKSQDLLYSLYKNTLRFLFKRLIKSKLTGVVTNGDFIKRRLTQELGVNENKIHSIQYPSELIYNRIDKSIARKKLALDEKEKIVLFFGNLRSDKNIELAIKSTANCKFQPLLIIAGSEKDVFSKDLKRWIQKYNHKNIRLDIDYISEEKMAEYYSASDLLLLTYNAETVSQSGPLSLAREFLLPALVTDAGEIGFYVKENNVGYVADPSNPSSFTDKLDKYFAEPIPTVPFENDLLKAKEQYSWQCAALKYQELFDSKII